MTLALPTFVGGMPGGMELAVIFMIFVVFVIPVGLVIIGVAVLRGLGGSSPGDEQPSPTVDERLDRVEAQLERYRRQWTPPQNQESESSDCQY